jgi:hypothetical protein
MKSLDFMIIGVQKGGTTALSHFLAQHPEIAMASCKEVHLFDAPDFDPGWSTDEINARYLPWFAQATNKPCWGEATPIYLYWPEIAAQLKRYNPQLKLIIILRDPVERALSHYAMELGRQAESRPLWQALLLESWRRWMDAGKRKPDSASRCHSYRHRGYYSAQIANLRQYFPDQQLLILDNSELESAHYPVLAKVFRFLGVNNEVRIEPERVFTGARPSAQLLVRTLLRWCYLGDGRRLKQQLNEMGYSPTWPWLR